MSRGSSRTTSLRGGVTRWRVQCGRTAWPPSRSAIGPTSMQSAALCCPAASPCGHHVCMALEVLMCREHADPITTLRAVLYMVRHYHHVLRTLMVMCVVLKCGFQCCFNNHHVCVYQPSSTHSLLLHHCNHSILYTCDVGNTTPGCRLPLESLSSILKVCPSPALSHASPGYVRIHPRNMKLL